MKVIARPLWPHVIYLCVWALCFVPHAEAELLRVVALIGTRPEAIKMAPVIWELQRHPDTIECYVVDTGQHVQMLRPLLRFFRITPNVSLSIMTRSQSLASLSSQLATKMDRALRKIEPHIILVQGDTTSAFVSGLTAFYNQIPVGHVEAGLRTYNLYSPFPEEVMRNLFTQIRALCRTFTDHLFLFPVHLNPAVQELAHEIFDDVPNIFLEAPITYDVFVHVLARCHLALTDSGGIQEEASYMGVPVLVMRKNTERPEGVIAGVSRLVHMDNLGQVANRLLSSPSEYRRMARKVTVYGDGYASERIVRHLLQHKTALVKREFSVSAELEGLPQLKKLGFDTNVLT